MQTHRSDLGIFNLREVRKMISSVRADERGEGANETADVDPD